MNYQVVGAESVHQMTIFGLELTNIDTSMLRFLYRGLKQMGRMSIVCIYSGLLNLEL